MHDCKKLRDDIWEAVETGEIPDDLLAGIGDCETCRRELTRAESAMQGFQLFRAVDAPDCSSMVIARIDSVANKRRAVWAYAVSMAFIVVIAAISLVIHGPHESELNKKIVRDPARHRVVAQDQVTQSRHPKQIDTHTDTSLMQRYSPTEKRERTVQHRWRTLPRIKRLPIKEDVERLQTAAAVRKQSDQPEPSAVYVSLSEQAEPQISIVIMDDSLNQEKQVDEAVEFSYTRTNTETGDVTEYSAKRTGKFVELNLEVKTGSNKTHMKGSMDHGNGNEV